MLKLNTNVVKRGSEPRLFWSNIHDTVTSYFELCKLHTCCREKGIASIIYQEILNKVKVLKIPEAYRILRNRPISTLSALIFS